MPAEVNRADAGEATVVGLCPWLPWPLNRSAWWTEPVRAERLAALRIGMGLCLLLDAPLTYLPGVADYFGANSLGTPGIYEYMLEAPNWRWSLLRGVGDAGVLRWATIVWAVATLTLTLGLWTRLSSWIVFALSTSFANLNPSIDNGGDVLRGIVLFSFVLTPCGAVWSLDRLWRRRRLAGRIPVLDALFGCFPDDGRAIFIHPWPLRLLFVQMMCIYWFNGLYKVGGIDWQNGTALYYVHNDLTLTRWSYGQVPLPYWLLHGTTWVVLVWEVSFPLVMMLPGLVGALGRWTRPLVRAFRWLRVLALMMGVMFHLFILIGMELGFFGPYMLCLYLPLLPWEQWLDRRQESGGMVRETSEVVPDGLSPGRAADCSPG